MSKKVFEPNFSLKMSLFVLCFAAAVFSGCSAAAKTIDEAPVVQAVAAEEKNKPAENVTKNSPPKGRILIAPNSPADAVRLFYKNLREKRFREAMLITNLRPAIESLSDAEMQDFNSDFEPLAKQVPADVQINGEIVMGDAATVTAKMPNEDTGVLEDKVFNLRREKDSWVILTVDEKAEAVVKKEGKNYFFTLRIEVHHVEAQRMLERITKAQAVYALQNGNVFADMQTLIDRGLLAADAQTAESTGYRYGVTLSFDKKKYFANAEPAVYGKTGKLSFLIEVEAADKSPRFKSRDNKGQPLKN